MKNLELYSEFSHIVIVASLSCCIGRVFRTQTKYCISTSNFIAKFEVVLQKFILLFRFVQIKIVLLSLEKILLKC